MKNNINSFYRLLLLVVLLVWGVLPLTLYTATAMASDVNNSTYSGTLRVTNNGTAASGVAVNATINTQAFIDAGYAVTNMTNTAILTNGAADTAYMPAPGATTAWVTWIPSIGANTSLDYKLYTGGPAMSGKIRYFPGTNGMSASDNASLEPGSNFQFETAGYLDTATIGASQNLIYKRGAFTENITAAGTIKATIFDDATTNTTVRPTGVGGGAWESIQGAVTAWEAVDEAVADDATTYIANNLNGGASTTVYFATGDIVAESAALVNNVTVYMRAEQTGTTADYQHSIKAVIRTNSTTYEGTAQAVTTSWANYSQVFAINPVTSDNWTVTEINAMQIGVWGTGDPGAGFDESLYCTQVYAIVNFTPLVEAVSVTATGISSGEVTPIVRGVANSPQWATGSVPVFSGAATSQINCGAVNNAALKYWISFWFMFDNNFTGASATQYIYGKSLDADNYLYANFSTGTGKLYWQMETLNVSRFAVASTQTSWTGGQWYHAILSVSDVDGVRMRINNGTAQTAASLVAIPNGGNVRFGHRNATNTDGFKGKMMNIVVGTDNLTPAEETLLYAGTAPGDETDNYYCEEGTGTAITSYGSAANPGTAGAAVTWTTVTYTSGSTGRLCDFTIQVGSSRWGKNLKGVSVQNTNTGWNLLQNNVMPYMEYHKSTIGGVLKQHITWENNASTFSDQSGSGNSVTPTFRTTSSDSDVWAELISFAPVTPAVADAETYGGYETMVGAPVDPGGQMDELDYGDLPGHSFINDMLAAGSVPEALFWFPFVTLIICAVGFLVGLLSPTGQYLVMMMGYGLACATIMPPVTLIAFGIIGLAPVLADKQFGW